MNTTFGDLHFHSTNSDGDKTPEERIKQIQLLDPDNLYPWAMTDHDCYSPNFVLPARELGIKAIWATEISAHSRELDCSLHVTCYSREISQNIKERIDAVLI
jgi:predicted metal-dependent phosphoesterase TrpH